LLSLITKADVLLELHAPTCRFQYSKLVQSAVLHCVPLICLHQQLTAPLTTVDRRDK